MKKKFYNKIADLYDNLQKADIKPFTSTKSSGQADLTYLSWGAAVDFFTKACHQIGLYWDYTQTTTADDVLGYEVQTTITVYDNEADLAASKTMTLPAMNNANKSVKGMAYKYRTRTGEQLVEQADSFIINKTKQRCLVKCMTLFGLGLSLYLKDNMDLDKVETGHDVAERTEKQIADMKKRIQALIDKLDPAIDLSAYEGWQDCTDKAKLTAVGIALKKLAGGDK